MFFFTVIAVCTLAYVNADPLIICVRTKDCWLPCQGPTGQHPNIIVSWYKNNDHGGKDKIISYDRNGEHYHGREFSGRVHLGNQEMVSSGNASVRIEQVTRYDSGNYTCFFSDSLTSGYKMITLFVTEEEVNCDVGENCVLPCVYKSGLTFVKWTTYPRDYTVYSNSLQVMKNQATQFKNRVSLVHFIGLSIGNASIIIKKVNLNDENVYKCLAYVRAGTYRYTYVKLRVLAYMKRLIVKEDDGDAICQSKHVSDSVTFTWKRPEGDVSKPYEWSFSNTDGSRTYMSEIKHNTSIHNYTCYAESNEKKFTGEFLRTQNMQISSVQMLNISCVLCSNMTNIEIVWIWYGSHREKFKGHNLLAVDDVIHFQNETRQYLVQYPPVKEGLYVCYASGNPCAVVTSFEVAYYETTFVVYGDENDLQEVTYNFTHDYQGV